MIERIGKYEVRAELGHGGMGRVYRAYDPSLDHDVAIKVLAGDEEPESLDRFRSEAGTTAKLQHKNIVTVHAFGEQDGMPYIVMELLNGVDLARIIREHRPLALLDKVRIMYQAAEGLAYAHQKGIVHRDIKPANIMVLPDGTVKIMDFGIARATGDNSKRRTQKGFVMGTMAYMAPEQLHPGLDADQLADIFAYGDVFYELITGSHPFQAEDPGTIMYRITAAEPTPVRQAAPECPESVCSIIHQLLAKDRELRYQNLRDAILDIEPALLELRQQRAEQILSETEPLIRAGRLDAALVKVKEALELDPVSRRARQFREKLQQNLSRPAVQAKLDSLLQEGDAMLSQRRFAEAVQIFENAARLDKTGSAQAKLDLARREFDNTQRAARLFAEARRYVQQGNLPSAYASASAAATTDPHNTQAAAFAKRIAQEMEKIERERRAKEAPLETPAQQQPVEIAALEKDVRDLARNCQFAEARVKIEAFQARYPGDRRAQQLLDTLGRVERADAIARTTDKIARFRSEGRLAEALDVASTAANDFRDHTPFRETAAQIEAQFRDAQYRAATAAAVPGSASDKDPVQQIVARGRALAAAGQHRRAIEELEIGLAQYPNRFELKDAAKDTRAELYRLERAERLRNTIQAIEASLGAHDFRYAESLLKAAREEFPTEARIEALEAEVIRRKSG